MHPTIANAIQVVNDAFPSIYTKDDVIKLLMSFDAIVPVIPEPITTRVIPQEMLEDLTERIVSWLEDERELFDSENVDFDVSVSGDLRLEIEIDGGVELDTNAATNAVEKGIEEWLKEHNITTEEEEIEETPQVHEGAY